MFLFFFLLFLEFFRLLILCLQHVDQSPWYYTRAQPLDRGPWHQSAVLTNSWRLMISFHSNSVILEKTQTSSLPPHPGWLFHILPSVMRKGEEVRWQGVTSYANPLTSLDSIWCEMHLIFLSFFFWGGVEASWTSSLLYFPPHCIWYLYNIGFQLKKNKWSKKNIYIGDSIYTAGLDTVMATENQSLV